MQMNCILRKMTADVGSMLEFFVSGTVDYQRLKFMYITCIFLYFKLLKAFLMRFYIQHYSF